MEFFLSPREFAFDFISPSVEALKTQRTHYRLCSITNVIRSTLFLFRCNFSSLCTSKSGKNCILQNFPSKLHFTFFFLSLRVSSFTSNALALMIMMHVWSCLENLRQARDACDFSSIFNCIVLNHRAAFDFAASRISLLLQTLGAVADSI